MNLVPGTQRVTADAVIGPTGAPIRVFSIELISGGTASTATLRNGIAATDTAYAQVDGLASQSVLVNYAGGKRFPNGCFFDADANISYATVVFAEEF